jgi:hypothetical protein
MNIKDEIKKENERHKNAVEFLLLLKNGTSGIVDYINHIDLTRTTIDIYSKTFAYDEFFGVLHRFDKEFGKYKLNKYYKIGSELCVAYLFKDNIKVMLYCSDLDKLLKKISDGKCRIAKNTYTEESVVCDL